MLESVTMRVRQPLGFSMNMSIIYNALDVHKMPQPRKRFVYCCETITEPLPKRPTDRLNCNNGGMGSVLEGALSAAGWSRSDLVVSSRGALTTAGAISSTTVGRVPFDLILERIFRFLFFSLWLDGFYDHWERCHCGVSVHIFSVIEYNYSFV